MEKEEGKDNAIAGGKILELLNAETDLAEKNLQKHGLSFQVLIFAVAALIWLFLEMLSSVSENPFYFFDVFQLYICLFLVWLICIVAWFKVDMLAIKKRALISSEHLSVVVCSLTPSCWLLSAIYTFVLAVLWIFFPLPKIYYFLIPISLILWSLFFYLFFRMNITYGKHISYSIPNTKYNFIDQVAFAIISIGTVLSVFACYKELSLNMVDIKYAFILFAITFLIDRIVAIFSKSRLYNTTIKIKRDFLSNRISTATVRKRLRFFITGETHGEAIESELQRIRETIIAPTIDIPFNTLKNLLPDLLSYLKTNEKAEIGVDTVIYQDLSFLLDFIIWKKREIGRIKKELQLLKDDYEKYNYDFRFQLGETPAPFQIHADLSRELSIIEKAVSLLEEKQINLFKEYMDCFAKIIPTAKEYSPLDSLEKIEKVKILLKEYVKGRKSASAKKGKV
ncbi:hypothetical protein Dip518_000639 [Parelusimicrobium proximum]|uniref:hypothetical protein n=1 Tax=Parelusimicrobium proximum TaxID=3228953 RepID=UPI003D16FD6A